MIKTLQKKFSERSRAKRGKMFLELLNPKSSDSLLDLGGGNGSHINYILRDNQLDKVTIADISEGDLISAQKKFGYKTLTLSEGNKLPFPDKEFDIVFCNSVIEHVTLPKEKSWNVTSTKKFRELSLERQSEFAREISRISNSYFVQTPYKHFIIESHTWLPGLITVIPRKLQINIIKFFNKFWPKKTTAGWNLLLRSDMQRLFPEARIYQEIKFGMIKSVIAVKTKTSTGY